MAYESITYEYIMNRMMERVKSQYPNLDRREGSLIYNAVAPVAIELAIAFTELDNVRRESFVPTASREFKLLGCKDIGMDISVFDATYGVHKGVFDVEVTLGSRWNCELFNYTVTEYIGVNDEGYHEYKMACETLGTTPNNQTGVLTPITDAPNGLTYAMLVECLVDGENEKTDEEINKAYDEYTNNEYADGNKAQYKRWCNEYDGIGNSKVFPLWDGANTVKVSILSASNGKANDELIDAFQEYLDPNVTGMGDGVAPIGAFVTVTTATEVPVNISANVQLAAGYTEDDTDMISTAITNYFGQIAYVKNQVSYMTLGATILDVKCVESINNLTINDGTSEIILGDEEIPVLGSVSWAVV